MRQHQPGDTITVLGDGLALRVHLQAWCREHRCAMVWDGAGPAQVVLGPTVNAELGRAERADGAAPSEVVDRAPSHWALAARGALVEPGAPPSDFDLDLRDKLGFDAAYRLYAEAAAAQWDPEASVDWTADFGLPQRWRTPFSR